MNGCGRWRDSLESLHEGSLEPARQRATLRHLNDCAGCREQLEALEEIDRLLIRAAPAVAPLAEEASRALFHTAVRRSGVLRRRPGWRRWLVGAAVAAPAMAAAWCCVRPAAPRPAEASPAGIRVAAVLGGREASPRAGRDSRPAGIGGRATRAGRALARAGKPAPHLAAARFRGSRRGTVRWVLARVRGSGKAAAGDGTSGELTAGSELSAAAPASPEGVFLVVMTGGEREEPEVRCRQAEPEAPGFARVAACQPGPAGETVWVQATVSSERPEPQLAFRSFAASTGVDSTPGAAK